MAMLDVYFDSRWCRHLVSATSLSRWRRRVAPRSASRRRPRRQRRTYGPHSVPPGPIFRALHALRTQVRTQVRCGTVQPPDIALLKFSTAASHGAGSYPRPSCRLGPLLCRPGRWLSTSIAFPHHHAIRPRLPDGMAVRKSYRG